LRLARRKAPLKQKRLEWATQVPKGEKDIPAQAKELERAVQEVLE
jgi:hypothetical protein